MNRPARLLFATLMTLSIAVSAGCANHPERRPFTAEETRQLALEALARQGLSFDEFKRRKAQLIEASGGGPALNVTPRA
jgi:hypothetical protein